MNWKPVEELNGLYEVSDCGCVRRTNGNELKLLLDTHGYPIVYPSINGKDRPMKVHRLVAKAFLPNPDNKPQVNHIDGVKTNNKIDNLEWVTQAENNAHAWLTGLNHNTEKQRASAVISGRENVKRSHEVHKKPVFCNETNKVYPSICDAAIELGVNDSKISLVAKGKRNQTGGFTFCYAEVKHG